MLSDIPAEDLYVDSAPHGTETTYYLAAMVTYQATYGVAPQQLAVLPEGINPSVGTQHDAIVALVDTRLTEAGILDGGAVTGPDDSAEPDPETGTTEPQTEPTPQPEPEPEPDPVAEQAPEPETQPEPEPESKDDPLVAGESAAEAYSVRYYALDQSVDSLSQVDFSVEATGNGPLGTLDFFSDTGAMLDGAPDDLHYERDGELTLSVDITRDGPLPGDADPDAADAMVKRLSKTVDDNAVDEANMPG